jgi:hypothetical protein
LDVEAEFTFQSKSGHHRSEGQAPQKRGHKMGEREMAKMEEEDGESDKENQGGAGGESNKSSISSQRVVEFFKTKVEDPDLFVKPPSPFFRS